MKSAPVLQWSAFEGLSGHPGAVVMWWRHDPVTKADVMGFELFTSPTLRDAARQAIAKTHALQQDANVSRIVTASVQGEFRRNGKVNGS